MYTEIRLIILVTCNDYQQKIITRIKTGKPKQKLYHLSSILKAKSVYMFNNNSNMLFVLIYTNKTNNVNKGITFQHTA